jgi:agmatine deiminase
MEEKTVDYQDATPASEGFAMPAEWAAHEACLMAWPSREALWGGRLDDARHDYAAVARAVSDFEPVVMACNPGFAAEVRDLCGAGVEPLEVPINDSWARDSGPIFVKDSAGSVAAVKFGFNAWGDRWHPYDDDARLPGRVASHLGVRLFEAPLVLEGGSIFVDGEGTLLTTEQCLLNPNRNPQLSKEQIEGLLKDYLGVRTVVWLPFGHSLDVGPAATDGHIDGIAQFVAPGHVVLEVPSSPEATEFAYGHKNLAALEAARDAEGRVFTISRLDPVPDPDASVAYANFYVANGAVIVPTEGTPGDAAALHFLAGLYPGREVVGVPGEVLAFGGGGPHCITQQIPASGVTPS